MTDQELSRLRDLASRATKGPWELGRKGRFKQRLDSPTGGWWGLCHTYHALKDHNGDAVPNREGQANAAFIAAANPKAVTELLDEITRLKDCLAMFQNAAIAIVAEPAPPICGELVDTLREAERQITYLHERFHSTGSGNAVLARIRGALQGADKLMGGDK